MTSVELELWNKIEAFEFDKPDIKLTFAKRLAKENGFSEQFANQIVDEYRRFIFLCCVSKAQIAPSHLVDLAWHLHLTYTRSYWIALCKNTIGRDLHHNPTEGGQTEDEKFKGLYADTLTLYKAHFSTEAPVAIWPVINKSPKRIAVEIDKRKNWIIPKPDFGIHKQKNAFSLVAIILLMTLLGCSSGSILLVVFFVAVVALIIFVRKRNKQAQGGGGSGCSASGCGGGTHHGDSGDDGGSAGGGDSGCSSSGCSGGCGGGGD